MGGNILEFKSVTKLFSGVPALREVSFSLQEGHVLGLVGENGAGKSTAMNILGGVIQPDAGCIRYSGQTYRAEDPAEAAKWGIAFIHQELNLFANLSIEDNFFIAKFPARGHSLFPWIDRKETGQRSQSILAEVGLFISPDTPVERLSQGERQLVEIAKALIGEARLIILDEPTTSLAGREAERLFDLMARLKERGISMVYVSHNLDDVLRLCDDVVILRDGAVVASGPRHDFTKETMISRMVGREFEQFYPRRAAGPSAEIVLEARGISQPGVVENICFRLHRGEILGMAGLLGAGRSELARILFGLEPFGTGELLLNGKELESLKPRLCVEQGMAFLTEDRREEGLLMEASVAENIALVSMPAYARRFSKILDFEAMRKDIEKRAESLRIKSSSLEMQRVKHLSGGNQQKVVLAKWLMTEPSVLILDEPTRGIDVGAKHELYRIINDLAGRGAGVLFISSEIEELMGMCDRVLVMSGGKITGWVERREFDQERILRLAFGEVVA